MTSRHPDSKTDTDRWRCDRGKRPLPHPTTSPHQDTRWAETPPAWRGCAERGYAAAPDTQVPMLKSMARWGGTGTHQPVPPNTWTQRNALVSKGAQHVPHWGIGTVLLWVSALGSGDRWMGESPGRLYSNECSVNKNLIKLLCDHGLVITLVEWHENPALHVGAPLQ